MWEVEYKESWAPKNWCFWTVVLEKTLESPLDSKEIQPVHPKGNQSWIFIGRTDGEAELQYFGYLMRRTDSKKRPWCWERLRAGGEGDDRGWDGWMASLTQWIWVWVDSGNWWWTGRPGVLWFMGRKESDMSEWLNYTELNSIVMNLSKLQELVMYREAWRAAVCGVTESWTRWATELTWFANQISNKGLFI